MKILIPIDGSACTGRLLEWLVRHDYLIEKNKLVLLHVVERLNSCACRWMSAGQQDDYYAAQAQPVWNLVRGYLRSHRVHADCRLEIGDPAGCIAAIARGEGFDLITMGSHGHGALANVVMGSVATKVLARCETPVLLVQ
jgi:nucleotide-binding universal stress UspA family protein